MATKIRLSRHGKKARAFYHIVVADTRSPRDGRYIEKIGTYNPNTNPATIELNFDRAVYWLGVGAQPTDTTRSILSHKGAMLANHLNGGVRKGALTEDQATAKLEKWMTEQAAKVAANLAAIDGDAKKSAADRQKAETAAKEAKAKTVASKLAAAAASVKAEEAVAEEVAEAPAEVAEEAKEAAEEAPVQ